MSLTPQRQRRPNRTLNAGKSRRSQGHRHACSTAFTLVELLVAMTVSLLLVVVLLRVFATATSSWQRGEAQVDAFREARGALQLMARDLSTVVQPLVTKLDGTTAYAAPQLPTLVLGHYANYLTPDPPRAGDEDKVNEEIYCLTNIINSATVSTATPSPGTSPTPAPMPSETCAVGYFCQWLPALANHNTPNGQTTTGDHAPRAFALMRQFLNSDGVYQRMKTAAPGSAEPLKFDALFTRNSLMPGVAPVASPPAATSTQLAAYIWDLKFRVDTNLADKEDGTPALPPADHGDPNASDPKLKPRFYDGLNAQPYPGVLPPYVEIRFKALSSTAGRRLEGDKSPITDPLQWRDTTTAEYRTLILPNARQFVLRVPLINSNPLPQP